MDYKKNKASAPDKGKEKKVGSYCEKMAALCYGSTGGFILCAVSL